jgi:NADH:ubiquinone oxidoreductase subunit 6 (subunit J)
MIGQLGCSAYWAFFNAEFLDILHLILVVITWIGTFVYFVPLHQKINTEKYTSKDLLQLEKGNWFRLIIWILIFIISFIQVI